MKTKRLTFGAMCLALSLLLPQVFHMMGMQQAGSIFLPMHLPVFIGGMLLGPTYGLVLGIFAPLASFVITGMPTAQRVVFMMSELAVYGAVSGLLFRVLSWNHQKGGTILSLFIAMITGRIVYGCTLIIATQLLHIPVGGFYAMISATLTGIPGILIQLILVPVVVQAIERAGYLHELEYSEERL